MKEINTEHERIMVSDSLVDKIDMRQFYETPDNIGDLEVTILSNGGSITEQVNRIKISRSLMRLRFFCNSKYVPIIILGDTCDRISLFMKGASDAIVEYDCINVVSRSIKISEDSVYECDLVVKLHNT